MKEVVKEEGNNIITELVKSADVKITLEQWPCTVAILGICMTCSFIAWINASQRNIQMA